MCTNSSIVLIEKQGTANFPPCLDNLFQSYLLDSTYHGSRLPVLDLVVPLVISCLGYALALLILVTCSNRFLKWFSRQRICVKLGRDCALWFDCAMSMFSSSSRHHKSDYHDVDEQYNFRLAKTSTCDEAANVCRMLFNALFVLAIGFFACTITMYMAYQSSIESVIPMPAATTRRDVRRSVKLAASQTPIYFSINSTKCLPPVTNITSYACYGNGAFFISVHQNLPTHESDYQLSAKLAINLGIPDHSDFLFSVQAGIYTSSSLGCTKDNALEMLFPRVQFVDRYNTNLEFDPFVTRQTSICPINQESILFSATSFDNAFTLTQNGTISYLFDVSFTRTMVEYTPVTGIGTSSTFYHLSIADNPHIWYDATLPQNSSMLQIEFQYKGTRNFQREELWTFVATLQMFFGLIATGYALFDSCKSCTKHARSTAQRYIGESNKV